jgi:hypothetical protein
MESTKTIKRAEGGGEISAYAAQNDSGHLAPFKISRR